MSRTIALTPNASLQIWLVSTNCKYQPSARRIFALFSNWKKWNQHELWLPTSDFQAMMFVNQPWYIQTQHNQLQYKERELKKKGFEICRAVVRKANPWKWKSLTESANSIFNQRSKFQSDGFLDNSQFLDFVVFYLNSVWFKDLISGKVSREKSGESFRSLVRFGEVCT